jgi:hypothetical protein
MSLWNQRSVVHAINNGNSNKQDNDLSPGDFLRPSTITHLYLNLTNKAQLISLEVYQNLIMWERLYCGMHDAKTGVKVNSQANVSCNWTLMCGGISFRSRMLTFCLRIKV